jgi:nucleoside-diphosphate-sugar epimerase
MAMIIGSTGFIGRNIVENLPDIEVLDRHLYQLETNLHTDTLYIAAPSASKWLVNSNPKEDLNNITQLASSINKHIKAEKIIVFSTVDVYANLSTSTELSETLTDISYGGNRRIFEKLLSVNECELYVFRLSGVFGKYLKKNIIYDLLNKRNSEVGKYNLNSEFQFIEISSVLKTCNELLNKTPGVYNLSSPPIKVSDLLESFDWIKDVTAIPSKSPIIKYNVKTLYNGDAEYMFKSEEVYERFEYLRKTYAN